MSAAFRQPPAARASGSPPARPVSPHSERAPTAAWRIGRPGRRRQNRCSGAAPHARIDGAHKSRAKTAAGPSVGTRRPPLAVRDRHRRDGGGGSQGSCLQRSSACCRTARALRFFAALPRSPWVCKYIHTPTEIHMCKYIHVYIYIYTYAHGDCDGVPAGRPRLACETASKARAPL